MIRTFEIDLSQVPDWHTQPSRLLFPVGQPLEKVEIVPIPKSVVLPEQVHSLRRSFLDANVDLKTFFPGPLASVERLHFDGKKVTIETARTDRFDYTAASYYFRDHQGNNPIRALAVQATVLTADDKIILDERPKSAQDFPGAYSLPGGGALTPEDTVPTEAIKRLIDRKMGLSVDLNKLTLTGLEQETINNVIHIYFVLKLNQEQSEQFAAKAVSVEAIKRTDITNWNPAALDNILCALVAIGLHNPSEVQRLLEERNKRLKVTQMNYVYPMEKYLPNR